MSTAQANRAYSKRRSAKVGKSVRTTQQLKASERRKRDELKTAMVAIVKAASKATAASDAGAALRDSLPVTATELDKLRRTIVRARDFDIPRQTEEEEQLFRAWKVILPDMTSRMGDMKWEVGKVLYDPISGTLPLIGCSGLHASFHPLHALAMSLRMGDPPIQRRLFAAESGYGYTQRTGMMVSSQGMKLIREVKRGSAEYTRLLTGIVNVYYDHWEAYEDGILKGTAQSARRAAHGAWGIDIAL